MVLPSVDPRVTIGLPEAGSIVLCLRMPSPMHLKERLEQVVLTRFLEQFYSETTRVVSDSNSSLERLRKLEKSEGSSSL